MKNKSLTVSIVIPNWNGRELMPKHLPSVLKAKENKKNNIKEIVVVDDYSSDDSLSYLKNLEKEKKIKLVVHKKNLGFSKAVNDGVKTAVGDLVCLLNTDVSVSNNFLENSIVHFEDEKVFAVSFHEKKYGPAKIFFKNGFFEHSNYGELKETHISGWASGGSAVFRKKIWNELGGMDNKILSPFYWEDVDLSYRAFKLGYKVLWEPKSNVDHQHESVINISNFKKKYMNNIKERNQLLFIWKNITDNKLLFEHVVFLIKKILFHPGYLKIVFLAMFKIGLVFKYRKNAKNLVVKDKTIFNYFSNK